MRSGQALGADARDRGSCRGQVRDHAPTLMLPCAIAGAARPEAAAAATPRRRLPFQKLTTFHTLTLH